MEAPKAAPEGVVAAAAEAEARYRRMCAVGEMSEAALARVLAQAPGLWIEAAAGCGIAEAQVRLGQLRLDAGRAAEAVAWFERAAAQGSAEGMNMLGRAWELGWAASTDATAAATWYARAADAGDAWGQYNYANMLFEGRGAGQDQAVAVGWWRRAADQGHGWAMNLLGRAHEEGWGAEPDMAAARDWYRRSAEAGYFRGQYNHAACLAADGRLAEAKAWLQAALDGASADQRGGLLAALRNARR